jgi:hypothetical protein
MMKLLAVLGLSGGMLFALVESSYAHYVYSLSRWYYHSTSCRIAVTQVPNQDKFPGTLSCTISPTTSATVFCAVPGNDYTFAGTAGIGTVTASGDLKTSGLTKQSGNTYIAEVTPFKPVLADYISACPNPNWTVVAVVLNEFGSVMEVKDSTGAVATRVTASCTLPPQYQGMVPPAGADYACNVVVEHAS